MPPFLLDASKRDEMLEKPGEKIGVPWRIDGRDAVSLDQGKQKIPDPLETEDPLHPHPRVLLIQEAADQGPDEPSPAPD
jgi:hypothetical protein